MAEFPGYEPRTLEEISYVETQYGLRSSPDGAMIRAAPAYRESLSSFVERKLCPRQPRGFAALVAAMLARDPADRPDAEQARRGRGRAELDPKGGVIAKRRGGKETDARTNQRARVIIIRRSHNTEWVKSSPP